MAPTDAKCILLVYFNFFPAQKKSVRNEDDNDDGNGSRTQLIAIEVEKQKLFHI